jgi:hypothetical protein
MVLTVSFALSSVTGLVCHRRRRSFLHQLDVSVGTSGPHDFAVRLSTFRQARYSVHRIPPRVRDDRDTPLQGTRRGAYVADLRETESGIFLLRGMDSRTGDLPVRLPVDVATWKSIITKREWSVYGEQISLGVNLWV